MPASSSFAKRAYSYLGMGGINPKVLQRSVRGLPPYLRDYREFKRQVAAHPTPLPEIAISPQLTDRHSGAGAASGHYFHQDLLVARRIFANGPVRHIDVASRFDGFVAHVAAFRAIEVLDVRPIDEVIPNVTFTQADLSAPVGPALRACTDSLSSLHAIEHFGLGRYGDPIDLDGHLKAIDNFHTMLSDGGTLYLSTPIGADRIEFNAQRVFAVQTLLDVLADRFAVEHFSYVGDDGALREDVELTPAEARRIFGCRFGCGIFELTKRAGT